MKLFKALINHDVDFVHSDVDAVWLKNPIRKYYTDIDDIDLIVSQGTIWPPRAFNKWQFVLCCGFFLMRANDRTRGLLDEIQSRMLTVGDDQRVLNEVLLGKIDNWQITDECLLPFNNEMFRLSDHLAIGRGNDITVGMIPFKEFPRLQLDDINPYVLHPLAAKDGKKKEQYFKKLGIWRHV